MSKIIQSIIERQGGSLVTIKGIDYKFKPNALNHHICKVDDDEAVDTFLSVTEGFCLYEHQLAPKGAEQDEEVASTTGTETETDLSEPVIGVATGEEEVVDQEENEEPETVAGEATTFEEAEAAADEAEVIYPEDGEDESEPEMSDEDAHELAREEYILAFGKKPHYKWSTETLVEKIKDAE